jgi:hypothetical protein
VKIFLLLVLGATLPCSTAKAQATAQIHGTIQDTTGAAVAGVEVKATQTDTGVMRTVISAADGSYVLATLPLGRINSRRARKVSRRWSSRESFCRSIAIPRWTSR